MLSVFYPIMYDQQPDLAALDAIASVRYSGDSENYNNITFSLAYNTIVYYSSFASSTAGTTTVVAI